ncbi:MAG: hypothetical protein LKK19_03625 [Bacteroidales bacterium]|jgi:hypothetical protein|nr:hypothetical protein [Bacteroidales bacterium]MCI2121776.1 hypothetical protein [Bacteroidales bacterium]MCI2144762.1 hypothetical protein [Bacteroidales bacterium]
MKKYLAILAAALMICACSHPAKDFTGKITSVNADTIVVTEQETGVQQAFAVVSTGNSIILQGSPVVVKYTGALDSAAAIKAQKVAVDSTYAEAVGSWMSADSTMTVTIGIEGAASDNCDTLAITSWELAGPVHEIIVKGQKISAKDTTAFTTKATISQSDGKYVMTDETTGSTYNKQ